MSLSKYSGNLILKGGLLIASMVGLDNRATMDIDTTIRNYNLSLEDARKMIEDIIAIPLDDGIQFVVKSVESIMNEAEYPGIRFKLEAALDTMKTPLKIDISTDDVITPKEVNYEYKLMFEEHSIPVLAYNLETVLAEKIETILSLQKVCQQRQNNVNEILEAWQRHTFYREAVHECLVIKKTVE